MNTRLKKQEEQKSDDEITEEPDFFKHLLEEHEAVSNRT